MRLLELSIIGNLDKVAYDEESGILSKNQRGFRPASDTTVNISDVIRFAERCQMEDRRNKSMLLFVDLKRAYDSVPRNRLLHKLEKAGIPQKVLEVIASIFNHT